jgi:hypothetical protein
MYLNKKAREMTCQVPYFSALPNGHDASQGDDTR